jgi:hypothetical protein
MNLVILILVCHRITPVNLIDELQCASNSSTEDLMYLHNDTSSEFLYNASISLRYEAQ